MNILLLEDKAARLYELEKLLTNHNHTIFNCLDIYEADQNFNRNKETIDCLIIDLAMNPEGLIDEEHIKNTINGYFTGWIWLKVNNIITDLKFIGKIIIFSAYTDLFGEHIIQHNLANEVKNICIISKNDSDWKTKIFNKLESIYI